MTISPTQSKKIMEELLSSGAVACGVAQAAPVSESAWKSFTEWLDKGFHAEMGYMTNHSEIRRDPRLLLEKAKSVVSLAFSFAPEKFREKKRGMIACYAYGEDYHDVLRKRLSEKIRIIKEEFGGEYRICIDSAPIMERYWAVTAGIGSIGRNGMVSVGKAGSMVFLAEVVTTLTFPEDTPPLFSPLYSTCGNKECNGCEVCHKSCPGKAIMENGLVDSRRCLSYLSIEHRGDWTSSEALEAVGSEAGRNMIFGCDICLRSCPLNSRLSPTAITEFHPTDQLMMLTREEAARLTQPHFSSLFKGTAIKRAKLAGVLRNSSR